MKAGSQNPCVFVVGCQRSGTTLLQQMLDAHPDLAVTCDTEFIPRVPAAGAAPDATLEPEIVERAIGYRTRSGRAGFDNLGLSEDTARRLGSTARTYADFVTLLFDEVAAGRRKANAGDKTPDYCRYIPLLHGLFPRARFVDIVRDGRDVTLSMLRWAKTSPRGPVRSPIWQESPIAACALWWTDMVTIAAQGGARLGAGGYLRVRYEDLIARPEAVLKQVTAFLGLPFASETLRYYEGKEQVRRPGETSNLPPTAGLRDWRTQMERRDLEVFESLAGDLLAELGYERGTATIPPEVQAQAEQWRRRWEKKYGPAATPAPGQGASGESRNPYVFVVGCQRSGTTLLQQMLDAHPDLAVTCDTEFIPRVPAAVASPDAKLEPEIVERAIGYRTHSGRAGFQRLELSEDTARRLAVGARTYADFVALLFDEVAASRKKAKAGDKTPKNCLQIPLLHALFPWARFVDIVRDGRDVTLSMLRWAKTAARGPARTPIWQENPIAACALWWTDLVTIAARDGARLGPPLYLRIRYEDLIARPETVLRQVTAFLGLPFAAEMLRYYEGKQQVRRAGKTSNLPPTAGLRDWRTQMERGDLEVFESLAGDLLEELGYARGAANIPSELQAQADQWRRRWEEAGPAGGDLAGRYEPA
jgi:Sulfotransferase family